MPEQTSETAYPSISAETRAEWRADAHFRGGVPHPTDLDPHVRFLANRIVRLLDALDRAETMHAEAFRIGIAKQERLAAVAALIPDAIEARYWTDGGHVVRVRDLEAALRTPTVGDDRG